MTASARAISMIRGAKIVDASQVESRATQVTHYTITEADAMVIMASDGVWEFLSSQARSA